MCHPTTPAPRRRGRRHYVAAADGNRQAPGRSYDGPGVTAHEIASTLETTVPLDLEKYSHYGVHPWTGPWVGAMRPAHDLLAMVVQVALNNGLMRMHKTWETDLEIDEEGRPSALVISSQTGALLVPIKLSKSGRLVTINGEPVSLTHREAGKRVIKLLALSCGAFLGSPGSIRA